MNFHRRQGKVLLLKDVQLMNLLFTVWTKRHSGNFVVNINDRNEIFKNIVRILVSSLMNNVMNIKYAV